MFSPPFGASRVYKAGRTVSSSAGEEETDGFMFPGLLPLVTCEGRHVGGLFLSEGLAATSTAGLEHRKGRQRAGSAPKCASLTGL